MLVLAGRGVGPAAVAELDLALVEVGLELGPLVVGDGPVLGGGPDLAPAGEVGLVVADDVFVEDGDVAAGGLEVEVAEQCGADVNGQPVVDQVSREQPPEVVGAEVEPGELGGVAGRRGRRSAGASRSPLHC